MEVFGSYSTCLSIPSSDLDLVVVLRDTDVHLCVPHELPARILEVHHMVLHCICDGVDAQLLGLPAASTINVENAS